MRSDRRKHLERNALAYLTVGDVDKPFHEPACGCELCDKWREEVGRPTFEYLRGALSAETLARDTVPDDTSIVPAGKDVGAGQNPPDMVE